MNRGLQPGRATPAGTAAYRARIGAISRDDFFSRSREQLVLSSLGIGTYLGEHSDAGDLRYAESLRLGLRGGVNVIDSAIKYRSGRSERVIGCVLAELLQSGELAREEVFVASKGGLTDEGHCIEPEFLAGELERSRASLGLETLDCYFVHNPELALAGRGRREFERLLEQVFALLEQEVARGHIASFGIASWRGFREPLGAPCALELGRMFELAGKGCASPHFRFVELPLSVGMPAVCRPGGALEQAQRLGLDVFTSGSAYEGKLPELLNLIRLARVAAGCAAAPAEERLAVSLPESSTSLVQLFELLHCESTAPVELCARIEALSACPGETLYPRALDLVRSCPGVTSALTSCDEPGFLRENLRLARTPRCDPAPLRAFWRSLSRRPGQAES